MSGYRVLRKYFPPLLRRVHPDYFVAEPALKEANQASLQSLNELVSPLMNRNKFDALEREDQEEQGQPNRQSPRIETGKQVRVEFFCRTSPSDSFSPLPCGTKTERVEHVFPRVAAEVRDEVWNTLPLGEQYSVACLLAARSMMDLCFKAGVEVEDADRAAVADGLKPFVDDAECGNPGAAAAAPASIFEMFAREFRDGIADEAAGEGGQGAACLLLGASTMSRPAFRPVLDERLRRAAAAQRRARCRNAGRGNVIERELFEQAEAGAEFVARHRMVYFSKDLGAEQVRHASASLARNALPRLRYAGWRDLPLFVGKCYTRTVKGFVCVPWDFCCEEFNAWLDSHRSEIRAEFEAAIGNHITQETRRAMQPRYNSTNG